MMALSFPSPAAVGLLRNEGRVFLEHAFQVGFVLRNQCTALMVFRTKDAAELKNLSTLLWQKTQGAPAHSQRSGGGDGGRVGANESLATPRPMPRDPATPLRMARRDAALLCSAGGFPGAAR